MDNLPPIPPIEGELMLEVYTHDNLNVKAGAITSDEHGGNVRLATLGESVLQSAVMNNLFRRRPMFSSDQLKETARDCLSKNNIDHWATGYNLRSKVRCAPGFVAKLKSSDEGRHLFMAYVGALCVQSGYNVVQDWINQLLEPSEKRVRNEPPPLTVPSPLPQQVGAPPNVAAASQARLYGQFKPDTPTFSQPSPRVNQPPPYMSGGNPFSSDHGSFPPKPAATSHQPQPPPPTTKPPPLPPTPNQQISFLPLFNQTASQRRLGVEYTAQFFGPPHAGKWHVKCLVNNIEKGQGTGPSKQIAKEEAAKQAFYAMGWST